MSVIDEIRGLLADKGGELYGGEDVTQERHALQCAAVAEADGASAPMVAAALLHDIGHLLDEAFETALAERSDLHHEDAGSVWLARWFGPEVTEPVRLHVDAKRYLCAVDPGYRATLSAASTHTLELQGGPFTAAEAEAFAAQPYARDAVQLRRWDDTGKDPAMQTAPLAHYLGIAAQVLAHSPTQ
jgi:gamma-butyrobetaine dioxygenase